MATDAVEVVAEEVASNLEELAQATRRINVNSVTFFLGGLTVGAAVGFYFGHKWNKEEDQGRGIQGKRSRGREDS